jgi:hypothetical protein
MKDRLGKTGPRYHPCNRIGRDKTAADQPRTDDGHQEKEDDIGSSTQTCVKPDVTQDCSGASIAGCEHECGCKHWSLGHSYFRKGRARQQLGGHYDRTPARPFDDQQRHG